MIPITPALSIDENELHLDFVRSSGPGGQNVNKVATAVQLRFDVRHSPSLPDAVRQRLTRLAGKQMTDDGVLIINAHQFRTQDRNRQDAIDRLVALIRRASVEQRLRRKTKPTMASKQRRLETKRRHGETKRLRRSGSRYFSVRVSPGGGQPADANAIARAIALIVVPRLVNAVPSAVGTAGP
jgi:ribosome-associated protein